MDKLQVLHRRSELLNKLRQFFYARSFVEVETPLLAAEVIPEEHIEPFPVCVSPGLSSTESFWLQASPELHMKQLLTAGMETIFQVTRSFRAGEHGRLHNPEFTIVEWYRTGDDMQAGIQLLSKLCQELLATSPAKLTSYREAFRAELDLCPHSATCEQLEECAKASQVAIPEGIDRSNRDEWLNLLLATRIEPNLGRGEPEILFDYPATQSALATVARRKDGTQVAERFELYWQGIELANGYHELTDADELRNRLQLVNTKRRADGRLALPMPESLLTAMQHGLPESTGCALGFDRLVMMAIGVRDISRVMAFPASML